MLRYYITSDENPKWYLSCDDAGAVFIRSGDIEQKSREGVWLELSHSLKTNCTLLKHQTQAVTI